MKSYKCPQCGFVGLATKTHCKNCNAPNPNPADALETYTRPTQISSSQTVAYQTLPVSSPQFPTANEPSYNSPPPPTDFGADYGQAYGTPKPPPPRYSEPVPEELTKALKHIRNAWIAGIVCCALGLVVTPLLVATGFYQVEDTIGVIVEIIIFAGLTFGVYSKSRVCAVLLFGLYLLEKIVMWAAMGNFNGIFLAIVFLIYFGYGIQGTFTYHKFKQQNPQLSV